MHFRGYYINENKKTFIIQAFVLKTIYIIVDECNLNTKLLNNKKK